MSTVPPVSSPPESAAASSSAAVAPSTVPAAMSPATKMTKDSTASLLKKRTLVLCFDGTSNQYDGDVRSRLSPPPADRSADATMPRIPMWLGSTRSSRRISPASRCVTTRSARFARRVSRSHLRQSLGLGRTSNLESCPPSSSGVQRLQTNALHGEGARCSASRVRLTSSLQVSRCARTWWVLVSHAELPSWRQDLYFRCVTVCAYMMSHRY